MYKADEFVCSCLTDCTFECITENKGQKAHWHFFSLPFLLLKVNGRNQKARAKLKLCIYSNNWENLYGETEAPGKKRTHISICILSVSSASSPLESFRVSDIRWRTCQEGHWISFLEDLRFSAAHKGVLN